MSRQQFTVELLNEGQRVFVKNVQSKGPRQAILNMVTNHSAHREDFDAVRIVKPETEVEKMGMTVQQKIQVTKEQAEVLDSIQDFSTDYLLERLAKRDGYEALKDLPLKDLVLAREVYGYEIRKTPEQLIRSLYSQHIDDANSGDYDRKFTGEAASEAIVETLNILGIKIDGVNGGE